MKKSQARLPNSKSNFKNDKRNPGRNRYTHTPQKKRQRHKKRQRDRQIQEWEMVPGVFYLLRMLKEALPESWGLLCPWELLRLDLLLFPFVGRLLLPDRGAAGGIITAGGALPSFMYRDSISCFCRLCSSWISLRCLTSYKTVGFTRILCVHRHANNSSPPVKPELPLWSNSHTFKKAGNKSFPQITTEHTWQNTCPFPVCSSPA